MFWIAYHHAPDMTGTGDPRSPLRAALRAFQHAQAALNAPGREMVLLRDDVPPLVLSDSGVTVRRKDGTYSITPPLRPSTAQLLASAPTHLLISAPPTTRYQHDQLTRRIAANANRGAAAWCQEAVHRLPSTPRPPHLHLADTPLQIPARPTSPSPPSDGPAPSTTTEHLHIRPMEGC